MTSRQKTVGAWMFLSPGVVLYTVFICAPLLLSIPNSLFSWSGIGPREFVGLGNYVQLFTHPRLSQTLGNALVNNLEFFGYMTVIAIPVCLVVAYLLYRGVPGSRGFKTIIFIPYLINVVAFGLMINLFFNPNLGLYPRIVSFLRLNVPTTASLYADSDNAMLFVFVASLWKGLGYSSLVFFAAFQQIPKDVVEASIIDGAGEVRRFFVIYLPLIWKTVGNIAVLTYIWSVTVFEMPFILGGSSGGVAGSMDVVNLFFYRRAFGATAANTVGMGTTIATFMFVLLAVGAIVQSRLFSGARGGRT